MDAKTLPRDKGISLRGVTQDDNLDGVLVCIFWKGDLSLKMGLQQWKKGRCKMVLRS
jgi:hypothetical protein